MFVPLKSATNPCSRGHSGWRRPQQGLPPPPALQSSRELVLWGVCGEGFDPWVPGFIALPTNNLASSPAWVSPWPG